MSDYTNFNGYSHGDLRRMVQSMDSGGVMSASDPWRKAAATLKQIRTALNTASGDATSSWEGATSDAFYAKMTKLANSVNNVAAYANDAAITMQMMSEAIDQAKRDMPEEPGFWDKVGDAVTDTAKSSVGVDDEDTKTAVTDEKKAQAVAVMQTLATKYRAATSYLKPPRTGPHEDIEDIPPPDSSGSAAISGMIVGGGMGFAGASGGSSGTSTMSRSSGSTSGRTPQSPKPVTPAPTDSGIKGGTANPAPKPQSPGTPGPGTGIDGVAIGTKPGGTGGGSLGLGGTGGGSGAAGGGHSGGGTFGVGGGGLTGGSAKGGTSGGPGATGRGGLGASGASGAGTTKSANAFGAGGMQGAGGGAGASGGKGGAGGRSGPSLVRRSGGVVGEAGQGGSRGRAFTEGGSGLGRGRGQSGQGPGGQGHGMLGGAQANKKDKKKGSERPDYLVEDEETWVSGDKANPNVVE
ncbi:hypothetical protein GCM10010193_19450 [Kitasatospora atroaurantiaca]|uniref:WXG100 family type VII secretion target n=1 Tax=Kitasatospora atroaurantiaca TaxID=285545 RepID=UPI0011A64BC2|nr:WXG100 family type VII secretion target [Kitasatospora atroaurantiaca]